jgi:hypothetical protein
LIYLAYSLTGGRTGSPDDIAAQKNNTNINCISILKTLTIPEQTQKALRQMVFVNVSTGPCNRAAGAEEFYDSAFRKRIYDSLETLQTDIDKWMQYNSERTHSGRYCYGKTSLQTFLDSKAISKSKNINELFDKSDNFKLPGKAEASSAGEQLVRNTRANGNEKGAENFPAPSQNHFLSNS